MPVTGRLQHPVSITEKQLTNLTESSALVNFLHNEMPVFCIESASLGLSGTSVGTFRDRLCLLTWLTTPRAAA
jgi:hypothetical protein